MNKKTRILNISPKAQLGITDCVGGEYPTILRTGDERTLGDDQSRYDDSSLQVYKNQNVLMPYNLEKKFVDKLGFLTGTISLNKAPTPSSQFLTSYSDGSYIPFKESRNPSAFFTSGLNAGFDDNLCEGFSSPISSKIAIPIDISLNPSGLAPTDLDIKVSFDGIDGTTSPFVYYNFINKTWDQIGVSDPATGARTGYSHFINSSYVTLGGNTWIKSDDNSSINSIVKQFTSSPGIARELSLGTVQLPQQGYQKIGFPTSFFSAPGATRYHAKSSQTLKLSDYITSPFILEKIQVQIPVKGTRYQNGIPKLPSFISGSGRDIDNHVFFVYRQNRAGEIIDSSLDVSSSIRSLIGNESFCFYNLKTMPAGIGVGTNIMPIHENQLEVDYGANITGADAIGTFTTDIYLLDMVFTPKTYEQQFTAASAVGLDRFANNPTNGYIQNYWDGGQKSVDKYTAATRTFPTLPQAIRTLQVRGNNQFLYTTSSGLNSPDANYQFDPRTLRSSTFYTSVREPSEFFTYFDFPTTSKDIGYRKNLYLLTPEDELVFGIDAGLFPTFKEDQNVTKSGSPPDLPSGYYDVVTLNDVGDPSKDTTSKLTIVRGEARVILYGTLVKDGVELMSSLNQKLTSPAIHEDIHQTITDQFQINESSLYAGTYIGNNITGSMSATLTTRGRESELSGMLSRFSSHVNFTNVVANSKIDKNSAGIPPFYDFLSKRTARNPIANFRYDRFGQFRDMLEQRIDTKGIETTLVSKNFSIPDFVKTFGTSPLASPVIVSFVSQSSTINADPQSTRSGNLSFECTSSLPYYDGEPAKNRTDIVFGENPPFEVQTVILGKPSSLLSST